MAKTFFAFVVCNYMHRFGWAVVLSVEMMNGMKIVV
jgi:hypothetical protein